MLISDTLADNTKFPESTKKLASRLSTRRLAEIADCTLEIVKILEYNSNTALAGASLTAKIFSA
jgi:hypothetical protein